MECSTQESSFVAAWGQEWIPNQRVGGYLVRNDDRILWPPFWYFYSFARHIDTFTIFPFSVAVSLNYVIHAYFCGLTADVLYDFATALEVISPLCPQFYFLLPFFLLLMLTAVFDSWCSLWFWYCLGSRFTSVPTTFPWSSRLGKFCEGCLSNWHFTLYIKQMIYIIFCLIFCMHSCV